MGFFGDSSPKSTVNAVHAPPSGILEGGGWTPSDVDFSGEDGFRRLSLETEELEDMLYKSAEGVVVLSVGGGYVLLNGKSFGGLGVSVINKLFIVNDLTLNQILKYSN